jgi:hypothetical protein
LAKRLRDTPQGVFLNVPYDRQYEKLFIALVGGLVCLGREPRCALEAADTGAGRLHRILDLIAASDASVHDLSRVQVSATGRVPRFNMPFELGVCCAVNRLHGERRHPYYVFEEKAYRLQRSLSDLGGYDPQVHGGSQVGVLRALLNCFGRQRGDPAIRDMQKVVRRLGRFASELKKEHRTRTLFEAHLFRLLVGGAAKIAAEEAVIRP